MKEITLKNGFKCELDEAAFDDIELFEGIVLLEKGDLTALPTILNKLLGDQKKTLYDHLREKDGRVPLTAVAEAIKDIILSLSEITKK